MFGSIKEKKSTNISILIRYDKLLPLFLFLAAILLYANTLGHEFTQDDAIVIYKNSFTTDGVSGINDIFSKDSFHGFFGENKTNLVSGGRYRPLTLAYFASLWEVFGANEMLYHFSSILMYGLLVLLIFNYLKRLRPFKISKQNITWAFITTAIFTFHPIHTEVVANVKGLDEIWSMMFGILASISIFKYVDDKKSINLVHSAICLILALLAKESGIAFFAIIPLSILFFRNTESKEKTLILLSISTAVLLYFIVRTSVIGFSLGHVPLEMMNNPFIKMVDGSYYSFSFNEKWATIIYGLGKYVQLLFFPHPLTHDYYPRHFEVMNFTNPEVILALIMNVIIVAFALVDFRRKSVTSFSALFYIVSIVLTSNLIFPIGTHLSERFLFTPSLAFAILSGSLAIKSLHFFGTKITSLIIIIFLSLFAFKTISRNMTWQSDYRLFTTDVHTSERSAKVQNAAGGAMLTKAGEIVDPDQQMNLRIQAKEHLLKAIQIHPNYKNAHLLLGNALFGLNDFDASIASYEKALQLDPSYSLADKNLILAYREGARYEGSQKGNIQKAIQYLFKADTLEPGNYETISLLGIAHGNSGQHEKALKYFLIALKLQPNNSQAHINLSNAYLNMGNQEMSDSHKQQAQMLK